MTGAGLTGWPDRSATIADAQTFACEFAMCPDFGMAGAIWIASPSTWMFFTLIDSNVRKSTSHQRLFAVITPACRAMFPARCGGTAFSTSALTSSAVSNFAVFVRQSTSVITWFGRYSTMPLYSSDQARLNRPAFDVTSGLPSRTSTLDFGFAFLKYHATWHARS